MISIFISYRRQDASQLADRIEKQLVPYGIDAYVDVSGVDGAGEFPQRLGKAIADAAVFVCLLGPTTLGSEWVVMEIRHAFALEKPMIPVFLQRFEKPTDVIDPAVLKLLSSDGVEMLDIKNLFIDSAIGTLAKMVKQTVRPANPLWKLAALALVATLLLGAVYGAFNRFEWTEMLSDAATAGGNPRVDTTATAATLAPTPVRNQNVERDFDGVTMVLVPKGCFQMGSVTGDNDEGPVHEVCLEPFWIDKTEVTQRQFREHGGVKASANAFSGDDRPVESITWFEARDFCALRGGRLPTEEEWEYAARGPDSLDYPWGDELVDANAVFDRDDESGTAVVGSLPAGASWVGALDMSGNVWEWTATEYLDYAEDGYVEDGEPASSSAVVQRVLRGGSWVNTFTSYLRTSLRFWYMADHPDVDSGFRCVREYDASDE